MVSLTPDPLLFLHHFLGLYSWERWSSERGCKLPKIELMGEIARYNEVDCRVMMEMVRYLRKHH